MYPLQLDPHVIAKKNFKGWKFKLIDLVVDGEVIKSEVHGLGISTDEDPPQLWLSIGRYSITGPQDSEWAPELTDRFFTFNLAEIIVREDQRTGRITIECLNEPFDYLDLIPPPKVKPKQRSRRSAH
jgi:hypothetical protein